MVRFYVGNLPHIGRGFSVRVARKFSFVWALEMLFTRIFCRNPDRIKVEHVIVGFGEPQNYFVTTRKPSRTVEPMSEVLDDPVAEF